MIFIIKNKIKINVIFINLIFLLLLNNMAFAQKSNLNNTQNNKNYTCWDYAGSKFNVDPWLLFAIADVESTFRTGIKSKNKNASYDLGLMQINTIHIPYFQGKGLSKEEIQYDSCKNIIAAAYLLRKSINKYGYNIDGIGGYHSGTPRLRKAYGQKVIKSYNELIARYYVSGEPFSFERHRNVGKSNVSINRNYIPVSPTSVNNYSNAKTVSVTHNFYTQNKNNNELTLIKTIKK